MPSIYRSREGKRVLRSCYERAVDRLEIDPERRWLETRHGETHVLLAGPRDGPPVVLFHGGNATNPMTLSWYASLADEYRLIAPDTIGQPGYSAETRIDPNGDGYGEWVVDLLDALEIDAAPTIGTSYGAGIILRAASFAPERIDRTALVVPAGFGTGSVLSLLPIGLYSLAYRYVPRERLLERVLESIVTEPDADPVVRSTVAASLRYVDLEREFPGADAAELEAWTASVALFVAEDDPFFPPAAIVPRAERRLRALERVEPLPGESHVLSASAQRWVGESIRRFFGDRSR